MKLLVWAMLVGTIAAACAGEAVVKRRKHWRQHYRKNLDQEIRCKHLGHFTVAK